MIAKRNPLLRTLPVLFASFMVATAGTPARGLAQAPPAVAPSAGPLTVTATHRLGTSTVDIRGRAPAGASTTVTITGEIARDLPVVLIARTVTVAGADGTYAVRVPVGVLSFPDSALIATASTAGSPPVRAIITVLMPDPSFNSPNNTLPPDK